MIGTAAQIIRERNISSPDATRLSLAQAYTETQPVSHIASSDGMNPEAQPSPLLLSPSRAARSRTDETESRRPSRRANPARVPTSSQPEKKRVQNQRRSPACVPPCTAPPRRGIFPNPVGSSAPAAGAPHLPRSKHPAHQGRHSPAALPKISRRSHPWAGSTRARAWG